MLRIGFDAKRAFLNHTGLGNYSRMVIQTLATEFPGNQYFLYSPKIDWNAKTLSLQQQENIVTRQPRLPFLKSLWRSRFMVSDLKKDQLDLYHGLSHELPIGIRRTGIRSVVTIHDLIFFRYPEYYKIADRKIYEAKFRYACLHADRIIAVSHQTRRDLKTFLNIPNRKVDVVYQSCDPAFTLDYSADQLQTIREEYQLPDRFLLNVGTIEARKNLLLLIKALHQLPDAIPLVVIGRSTPYANKVMEYLKKHQISHRVRFLQQIPFQALPLIYRLADIFIYPSQFEGFGIPLLEALSSGIPAIATTGSCLEESGGSQSIYVDPNDPYALADAIQLLWNDAALREKMAASGREYAAQFAADVIGRELMEVYSSVLNTTGIY